MNLLLKDDLKKEVMEHIIVVNSLRPGQKAIIQAVASCFEQENKFEKNEKMKEL